VEKPTRRGETATIGSKMEADKAKGNTVKKYLLCPRFVSSMSYYLNHWVNGLAMGETTDDCLFVLEGLETIFGVLIPTDDRWCFSHTPESDDGWERQPVHTANCRLPFSPRFTNMHRPGRIHHPLVGCFDYSQCKELPASHPDQPAYWGLSGTPVLGFWCSFAPLRLLVLVSRDPGQWTTVLGEWGDSLEDLVVVYPGVCVLQLPFDY
jgi:hypothetical protein